MDGQKKNWLINKNGEVLGPMALEDLVQGVVQGEFDIKMEAKLPKGGWRSLSHHKEIAQSLEKSGFVMASGGETSSTAQFTQSTTVQNGTQTEPTVDLGDWEGDFPEVTVVHGAPVQPPPTDPSPAPKVYQWSEGPASPRTRLGGYLFWGIVLIFAVIGGWGVFQFKKTGTNPLTQEDQVRELTYKADQFRESGNFQEALSNYRKALEIQPHNSEVQKKLVPLLLREEHQSVMAGRLIHQLSLSLTRPEDLKELYNLKGLSELYAENWKAARASFDDSLAQDSIYAPARWNRAMTYFMEGDFTSAITDFSNLKSAFPEPAMLLQQWSYFEAGHAERVDFGSLIEKSRFALQQESFFLGLWISTKLGATDKASLFADKFLSADMKLSELHYWDPVLFLNPFGWSHLLKMCGELEGHIEPQWKEEAVLGLCHLKAHNNPQALEYFEKSLSRRQNNLAKTLLAHMYFGQGDVDRARLLLTDEPSELADLLTLKIMALSGMSRQMEEVVSKLIDERYSLQKEYFQAWIALQQGALDKSKFHWRRAQALSPSFYPLRELQKELYRE